MTRFIPQQIDELLGGLGFRDVVHFGAAEARATYLAGRADVELAGAQRIAAATVR